jgi:hypothetical protein
MAHPTESAADESKKYLRVTLPIIHPDGIAEAMRLTVQYEMEYMPWQGITARKRPGAIRPRPDCAMSHDRLPLSAQNV